jgi:hypothetical protein
MDFSAVSSSNILKLSGCLHPSLTNNSVEPVFLIHCLFMFYGYKQTARFGTILKKTLKGHEYGYQMKDIGLGSKNMSFIFRFLYLFIFRQYIQRFGTFWKNAKRSSIWVSNSQKSHTDSLLSDFFGPLMSRRFRRIPWGQTGKVDANFPQNVAIHLVSFVVQTTSWTSFIASLNILGPVV